MDEGDAIDMAAPEIGEHVLNSMLLVEEDSLDFPE